ncbi:phosphatase PAP2 family protein [Micromonospora sp. RL09-050-HVF-A]|uniref:phosphatase PAP2 family protein n=1 Tax=Micromonospora sp. RL09-050-HVF-A TaxID=1703433 RepID=UPI001C5DA53A|nr:phosphatase PAP2 family protein [Micromonospora sp. RL09-050-HVF-A]MBW4703645.1 phosphatase PAP2 family protein [Micromonospora sp. RL09-050-HVF-A]
MSSSGPRTSVPPSERSWRDRRLDRDHSLGLRLTLASAAAFLLLVPFALLAVLVVGAWSPLHGLDAAVTDALHRFAADHPVWVRAMKAWTHLASPGPLRVAALVVVVWSWRRGARRLALWVVTTMAVGGALGALLKLLVGRDRPELLDPVARAAGFSFPSGHALNATLAAGVLLLVFLPFTRGRPVARVLLWTAAVLLVGVTGLSRVALGVHWASDVLGGCLLGVAVVAATTAALRTWREQAGLPAARATVDGVSPEVADRPGPYA